MEVTLMASIHREIAIRARPEDVWAAIRDVGAVHWRLVPGLLGDAHVEGGARGAPWANGMVVRELIVDIDDETRRFAYAAVGGRTTHHNSSMQVFADGEGRRLVWITDLLPNELPGFVADLADQGAAVIKRTLEADSAPSV
jgi:carbon monoxide dehydrogenase subunit G